MTRWQSPQAGDFGADPVVLVSMKAEHRFKGLLNFILPNDLRALK